MNFELDCNKELEHPGEKCFLYTVFWMTEGHEINIFGVWCFKGFHKQFYILSLLKET